MCSNTCNSQHTQASFSGWSLSNPYYNHGTMKCSSDRQCESNQCLCAGNGWEWCRLHVLSAPLRRGNWNSVLLWVWVRGKLLHLLTANVEIRSCLHIFTVGCAVCARKPVHYAWFINCLFISRSKQEKKDLLWIPSIRWSVIGERR